VLNINKRAFDFIFLQWVGVPSTIFSMISALQLFRRAFLLFCFAYERGIDNFGYLTHYVVSIKDTPLVTDKAAANN
jgi:hypothetical protein